MEIKAIKYNIKYRAGLTNYLIDIVNFDSIIFEIIICIIATFSAIQEGHYIRTRKCKL